MTPFMPRCYLRVLEQCHVELPPLVGHCPLVSIPVDPTAHIGCSSEDRMDVGVVHVHVAPLGKQGDVIHSTSFYSIFINCNTRFLFYVVTCELCSVQYVGRTTHRLRDRLQDHLYDIA